MITAGFLVRPVVLPALLTIFPHSDSSGPVPIGLGSLIALSVINPLFEEVFVCGYVIAFLRRSSDESTAIAVSTAIRLLYHFYQGAAEVISMIPVGFSYCFARRRQLWSLVVAHGLVDFAAGYLAPPA